MPLARVHYSTLLVLHELLTCQDIEVHGYAVVQATRLSPGSVYPILNRLEKHGWITSRWEDPEQRRGGAPLRRCYRFVEEHRAEAAQLLADRMGLFRKVSHSDPPD